MPGVAAVILAGGRGERLGSTIKANLEVGGERLLTRVVAAIGDARPVLVARGSFLEAELPLPKETIAVSDRGGGGPLAGLVGALDWLNQQQSPTPSFLLSVAVDTPFFPGNFLAVALEEIGSADALVARFAGQDYPTNALWRVATVAELAAGARSLRDLLTQVRTLGFDWRERCAENPFANANTPADLAALDARATAHFGVGKPGQTR